MAFDAASNLPPSRSYFQKSVSLQDWWLTKPQTDDDRKTIGVSGVTCTSQLSRADRCFSSAPIVKAYDFFELETVDSVCVILQGYINKDKTLESGFSSDVFGHFVIGFPPYWEEFCTSCPKTGYVDECVSRANEDWEDFDETYTGVENREDKASSVCETSSLEIPHEEHIVKDGDKVSCLTSECEDIMKHDVVGNNPLLKKSKMESFKRFGVCSRRTTRSMTKMDTTKNHSLNLDTVFIENLDIGKKDKERESKDENESQIDTIEALDPLKTATKATKNNKRGKQESTSKRKLRFGSPNKSTSTPSTDKGPTERYVDGNILSPESFSGKRSRSGRVLLPSLEFWRNQTVVYNSDRQVTGVRDVGQSSKDASKDSKASKKKVRRA